jgi:glycosyltransferase involved in cell wall biosynthesis
VRHPLRPLLRWWFPRQLRRVCAEASAVTYVTERALQRRYPPTPSAFSIHCSDVELPPEALVASPRKPHPEQSAFALIMVGTLAQLYKAPDVLIKATAQCIRKGLDLRLSLVGDGKFRPALEQQAAEAGLGGRVRFLGQLPAGERVRAELDRADVFVLPSRHEGLPRAIVEAMARGLPCIASTVGGIPELLPESDMVPPGDTAALARKIREVIESPERMAAMSARNLQKAGEYMEAALAGRRTSFYQALKERTDAWRRGGGGGG